MTVGVLLVAGVGSRLRPLTDDRPKALMDVGGETILHRAVRLLREAGIARFVVATGYREDAVRAALDPLGIDVTYCPNPRFDATQNSVSLALCEDAIGDHDFVKLDGDVVFQRPVIERLLASHADLAVAVDRKATLADEEMKVLVEDERITAFGKHLDPRAAAGESIGIERVARAMKGSLFAAMRAAIDQGRTGEYYEKYYDDLVRGGLRAELVDVTDLAWTEVDTLDDLVRARSLVASW